MLAKDLKKTGVLLSASLTTIFEGCINLIHEALYRQILNPLIILFSIGISVIFIHGLKCYSHDKLIKNNEEEIEEYTKSKDLTDDAYEFDALEKEIRKCKKEMIKLKREKSKFDFFY